MLQWIFCLLVLLAEMAVCSLVILPFPVRWRKIFLQKISNFWNHYPRARIVTKTCLGVVGLFFVDSIRSIYLITNIVDPVHPAKPDELNLRTFAAQRNAFLTGFTLFIFFLLSRFETMLSDVISLERRVEQASSKYEEQEKDINTMLEERKAYNRDHPDSLPLDTTVDPLVTPEPVAIVEGEKDKDL